MSSSKQYITSSSEETQEIAQEFGRKLKSGDFIALFGELGSGKTTFAQGLMKGLGVKKRIISPTFIIIRKYKLPERTINFYHVDLYRIEGNVDELSGIGITELIKEGKDIIAVEWAEKMKDLLPQKRWNASFKHLSENKRRIEIACPT